jgi:hypothetical protein
VAGAVSRAVLEFRTDTGTVLVDAKQMKSAIADLGRQSRDTSKDTSGLSGSIANLGKDIATTAAGFLTAQVAMNVVRTTIRAISGEISDLVMHGSAVSDVSDNFDHLTKSANLSGAALLGALRQGTHNTIADFDLMKITNEQLGAGLRLTEKDMGTLAKGAFALAQATGGDVKTALETMSDAMLTGRTKGLALLTGKINLTDAEKKFAASLGASAEQLTEEGKLQAARAQILKIVALVTQRLGDQVDGLDERVAQLQTRWRNFNDDLGKATANSPVLNAAFTAMEESISQAFGKNQKDLVTALSHEIDQLAINVVEFAQTGVSAVGFLIKEFIALFKLAGQLQQVIDGNILTFKFLSLAAAEAMNASTLGMNGGFQKDITRINNDIDNLMVAMKKRGDALQAADRAQDMVDHGASQLNATLVDMRAKMVAAAKSTNDTAAANDKAAGSAKGAAGAFGAQGDALVDTGKQMEEFQKKLRELATEVRGGLKVDTLPGATMMNDADFEKEFRSKLEDARRMIGVFHDQIAKAPQPVRDAIQKSVEEISRGIARLNAIDLSRFNDEMANAAAHAIELGGGAAELAKANLTKDMQIGESAKRRSEVLRDVAHTEAEIDFQRAEAGIESAKRWGASWQTVYGMEARLSAARLQVQLTESRQAFDDRVKDLRATGYVSEEEYSAMQTDQERKERLMVESWRLGEQAKRDELALTHNIWLRTWENMRAAAQDGVHALSESITGLLLAPARATAESKLAAEQARKDYEALTATPAQIQAAFVRMQAAAAAAKAHSTAATEAAADAARDAYDRMKNAATATPLEIQAAFERMRAAEDAANTGFGKRFVGVWQSIKRSITKILDDILDHFITGFLKGMLDSLARTSLGQRVGGWLGNLIGGGGGNGGGLSGNSGNPLISNASGAAKLASKLFGGGGAAATAMTVDTLPGALAATTATVDTLATAGVAGGTAAGGTAAAGGAAGGGLGALGAFFTNPWTIGIGATIVAGLLIAKKFGKDKSNKPRDSFFNQFVTRFNEPDRYKAMGKAFAAAHVDGNTADMWIKRLDAVKKDNNRLRSVETQIAQMLEAGGVKGVQVFHDGGVIGTGSGGGGLSDMLGLRRMFGLRPNEELIKALRGEGVLTPRATRMIGGGRGVDALNSGNVAPLMAFAVHHMNGHVRATMRSFGVFHNGGVVGGGSRTDLTRIKPWSERVPTGQRLMVDARMFVEGLIDGGNARELHEKHTRRFLKEDLFFNADGMASAVAGAR